MRRTVSFFFFALSQRRIKGGKISEGFFFGLKYPKPQEKNTEEERTKRDRNGKFFLL